MNLNDNSLIRSLTINSSNKLPTHCSLLNYSLTIDEMYNQQFPGKSNFLVEGYLAPRFYVDPKKQIEAREIKQLNELVWAKKKLYPLPKFGKDKDGQPIIPTKKSYIDDVIKIANSCYDKEKADKYLESSKASPTSPNKKPQGPKMYSHDRETLFKQMERLQLKEFNVSPEKESIIQRVIDKQGPFLNKKLHWAEENKLKYTKKGSVPRDIRSGLLADSEYVGESIPYYNTFEKKDEVATKGTEKKLFYPSVLYILLTLFIYFR